MTTARRCVPVLLMAVLLMVGGCAGNATSPNTAKPTTTTPALSPFEQQRLDGVTATLTAWTTALRSDDENALRSLFDPAAPEAFVQAEIARARNLQGVPFSDFGYEIGSQPETPVSSALAATVPGAIDLWAPEVLLRYAISDSDIGPTRRPVSLLLARRGDTWKLVSDTDLPDSGRSTWRGPWDFGPVIVSRVDTGGTTSTVLGHPDRRALVDALAAELPTAVPAVTDYWGQGWSRRAVVMVADSDAEFAAEVGSASRSVDVAASTISDPVTGPFVTGQRVVFGPAAADRLTGDSLRTVLRHELTHVAVRSATVDGAPLWVLEGLADYSGYRGDRRPFTTLAPLLAGLVRANGAPTVLPADEDFAAPGDRGALAYESAYSVWLYVADRYGEATQRTLYRSLATITDAATRRALTSGALQTILGVDYDTFVAGWSAWVAQQVGQ